MKTALLLLMLAAGGSDAYYTNAALKDGATEQDPFARPFVSRKAGYNYSMNALEFAGTLCADHWLRKHHHKKMALALDLSYVAGHSAGAGISATKGVK